MDMLANIAAPSLRKQTLLGAVRRLVTTMRACAGKRDKAAEFPADEIADLTATGALSAPFPICVGGLGLGTEPDGCSALLEVLTALGQGNMAVGRLYEAHVNAVRLIARLGTDQQLRQAFADAENGEMFGLWVTDASDNPLRASSAGRLTGSKGVCSGAGHIAKALVTVLNPNGRSQLAYISTCAAKVMPGQFRLQGMRAASTGYVEFDGCLIEQSAWIGAPEVYLEQPDFSAGSWRTFAVICGGIDALVETMMQQIVMRGRDKDLHQRERVGHAWIASQTARLWLSCAAQAAEFHSLSADPDETVATVNFARTAIESAALDILVLVQRSIGLGAFIQGSDIERLTRDLATYLRQPAGDEALTEAAAHVLKTRVS